MSIVHIRFSSFHPFVIFGGIYIPPIPTVSSYFISTLYSPQGSGGTVVRMDLDRNFSFYLITVGQKHGMRLGQGKELEDIPPVVFSWRCVLFDIPPLVLYC